MARQVAHDIENPLTPIQLSAEHLRRVHHDRGEPLSPVLERCVETILSQVRLLRRIFSRRAQASPPHPVVRRELADLGTLVREVADSYRAGLDHRYAFEVAVAADLPGADAGPPAGRARLRQRDREHPVHDADGRTA